jgi:thiamine pyrophosphate-dependent acetolactate synthase large subunit-like protein
MLSRREAIELVLAGAAADELAIFANGYVSRDGYGVGEHGRRFYMLGSMGLAGAIGLGVCLAQPDARVVVFDGDGNLLMGLGVVPMIGAWRPRSLVHVVLDNGTYGSTGGQETVSGAVDFVGVALACGYARATRAATADEVRAAASDCRAAGGPTLLHVPVDPVEATPGPRVEDTPPEIAARFARAAAAGA